MARVDVLMPQMGESIAEGTLSKWLKKVGDPVKRDEPLFEISTDKVDAEIPAPAAGVLAEIKVQEGQTVPVQTLVAVLETEAGATASKPAEPPKSQAPPPPAPKPEAPRAAAPTAPAPTVKRSDGDGGGVKTAEERFRTKSTPLVRKITADHMVMSKRVSAHVASFFEVDFTRVAQLRAKAKQTYAERGVNLTFLAFIAKACAENLRKHPIVNTAVSGDSTIYRADVNIGIAVALDWGLIVPVIKHADELSLIGIARAINDLGERARTKKLLPDDIQRGTFTITNPGGFGPFAGIPIINQPQVAILGVGAIEKRPKVVTADGTDSIAIRTMGMLTMSYDHRVVDGADADKFLADVKQTLQEFPEERCEHAKSPDRGARARAHAERDGVRQHAARAESVRRSARSADLAVPQREGSAAVHRVFREPDRDVAPRPGVPAPRRDQAGEASPGARHLRARRLGAVERGPRRHHLTGISHGPPRS